MENLEEAMFHMQQALHNIRKDYPYRDLAWRSYGYVMGSLKIEFPKVVVVLPDNPDDLVLLTWE